jgi:hypothetical protein
VQLRHGQKLVGQLRTALCWADHDDFRQAVVTTRRRETMTDHKTGTREEWLAARLELLEAEKALTRRSDELARWRQELPWVRIDKEYHIETSGGHGVPRRPLQRTLAAPHLSLHVRARVHGGVSVLLGDRGRLRRLRRPPRDPSRLLAYGRRNCSVMSILGFPVRLSSVMVNPIEKQRRKS